MNLLAAATPVQPAPAYNPAYQNQGYQGQGTMQPDKPAPHIPTTVIVVNYIFFFCKVAIIIFMIVMFYKFVKAFEKIANRFDKGVIVKKDDTTTT
jgi:hypothetical protein